MAALKLAIKLNEPRTLNMEDMIKLGMGGDKSFSSGSLVEMEYEILWKVMIPWQWGVLISTLRLALIFYLSNHVSSKLNWDIFPP